MFKPESGRAFKSFYGERAIAFIQSTSVSLVSPRIVFEQISGHPMAQSSQRIKIPHHEADGVFRKEGLTCDAQDVGFPVGRAQALSFLCFLLSISPHDPLGIDS